jgi:hypothetical protein
LRVLNLTLGLLVIMTALAASPTIGVSTAEPPESTDHGVDERTFHTLWSGDEDTGEGSIADRSDDDGAEMRALAARTDIPLDSPPVAVERWNRGDLGDFPQGDATTSIHPPGASLSDGRFVRDAHTSLFAVHPSTRANLSPDDQPLYVAPDGEVLGIVDYGIRRPSNDTTAPSYEYNRLLTHGVTETRLFVDDQLETRSGGTHTLLLAYNAIDEYIGSEHTLTLEADIDVAIERRTALHHRDCTTVNNTTTCVRWWENETSVLRESVTVADSINVTVYDLEVSGFRARYPNGDLGLVVYKNRPWLGHSVPDGSVRGVWRFYSARDPEWDTLVVSTRRGQTTVTSPMQPLQVHAYPFQPGPTPSSRSRIDILETYGVETTHPELPPEINLDAMDEPYTASFGIATRTRETGNGSSTVTAFGLVRGVSTEAELRSFSNIPIHRSDLRLSITETTPETVTVAATLRDARTGEPIDTSVREGYVLLGGQRVNTTVDGTVTRTFPRSAGNVAARYVPGRWWYARPGYTGDSDAVFVSDGGLQLLERLYGFAVPVALFLLGAFLLDRITGWPLWPPWRDL